MNFSNLFSWGSAVGPKDTELPVLFPMPVERSKFVKTAVQNLYARILTEVFERTANFPEEKQKLLWDNCVASELPDGLITMLSKAMAEKSELFIVYDKATEIVRKATNEEAAKIKADYAKGGKSSVGTYISFKNFSRTDMVEFYTLLEFHTAGSLFKTMNIAQAIQLKISDLRASVSLADSDKAQAQAAIIAKALADGRGATLDAKDVIEMTKPDLTATQASETFINQKLSRYTGMPASWITGEEKSTMGDTGSSDAKAIERGLIPYFFSIVKPVCEALFDIKKLEFETEDYASISSSLEVLKTFDVTSDDYLGRESKQKIVNKVFGLPADTKGDEPQEPTAPPIDPANPKAVDPANQPPKPGAAPPKAV